MRLDGQVAIVTGGTRGLGRAIGLELARVGADVVLTHRWGSADEDELVAAFTDERLPAPWIVESDVADPDATRALLESVRERFGRLDVLVSNVAFAKVAEGLADLKRSSFELSLRYSAWPVVDFVQASGEIFGAPPRRTIAISSLGAEVCPEGYDLAGAAKASLEMLCRYLALRVQPHGATVNVLRTGYLDTASARATFGDETIDELGRRGMLMDPAVAARACVALASEWMAGVTGHVLHADAGWSLRDPIHYVRPGGTKSSASAGVQKEQSS
ncbi:MAG: SDR family oxidoreductase [Sandaracinus sp.]|nr:SDR family oxidoreductase [Sandaracinus sp.]MCB9615895.1 SDR family oxidoreductase [Sandaracinus sp.]MCB9624386.1 SDR family oxidoreductase [Sandaracinus sp.]